MRRRAPNLYSVSWVVGIPQSGKTTLAVARAIARARERRVPLLAVDPARVAQIRGFDRAGSAAQALEALYAPRSSTEPFVAYTPSGVEDLDALMSGARAGKDLVVLVDEAHYFLSAQSGSSAELVHCMREAQHSRTDLFLTTQHLSGDIPQSALSCTSRLHVFRCSAPRVLQLLEREFGLPRARVARLERFRFLTATIGFQ